MTRTICAAFTEFPEECEDAITDKLPTVGGHGRLAAVIWTLVFVLPLVAAGAWAYRVYVQKSLYRSLREEVMLEVRAQIQDYALLGEAGAGSGRGAIQMKNFTRE